MPGPARRRLSEPGDRVAATPPATAAAVVRCRKRTPACALAREPWSAGPAGLGPTLSLCSGSVTAAHHPKPPHRTQGETP
jgi:hypothetical protein